MTRLPIVLLAALPLLLALSTPGVRADAPPAPVLDAARGAAQRDLDKSLKSLADLRASIQAETVPLTRELRDLEAQLADERRKYDETSRGQDTARLDYENLGQSVKLRQDEATYIGSLLDEYARGFETTLHVGERPRVAKVLEEAKQASQEKDLSPQERSARQFALLKTSIDRLEELSGGTRFPGEAVDAGGTMTQGTFAVIGPVSLFAAATGKAAGVALPQAGSETVAVRPVGEQASAAIAQLVAAGQGLFPFDPSRGGALQELINKGSLIGYFKRGGPIMWPLLLVSVLTVTVILERLFFLARERRRRDPETVANMMSRL
jgi:biopolymer transport protein ExbB